MFGYLISLSQPFPGDKAAVVWPKCTVCQQVWGGNIPNAPSFVSPQIKDYQKKQRPARLR